MLLQNLYLKKEIQNTFLECLFVVTLSKKYNPFSLTLQSHSHKKKKLFKSVAEVARQLANETFLR